MELPHLGVFAFLDELDAATTVDLARAVERLGYGVLRTVEAVGRDALAHAGHLLAHTDTLVVGSGVASMWTRTPPQAMAAARTHAEASGGRFVLGVGVNNPLSGTLRGFTYERPVASMRDFLAQARTASYGAPAPASDPSIVLAALQPRMLRLASREAAGTLPYFVTPAHTRRARVRPSSTAGSASSRPSCSRPTPQRPAPRRARTCASTSRACRSTSRTCAPSASTTPTSPAISAIGWWTRSSHGGRSRGSAHASTSTLPRVRRTSVCCRCRPRAGTRRTGARSRRSRLAEVGRSRA